nr:immunoglobulin heavy chain junction region [Macaca mulatta]MOV43367.1 immunoglobulin heavy chain junction region [Macaca mulatta]
CARQPLTISIVDIRFDVW